MAFTGPTRHPGEALESADRISEFAIAVMVTSTSTAHELLLSIVDRLVSVPVRFD